MCTYALRAWVKNEFIKIIKDFKLFKFTLLLSVTLIFDWLVISRTGALMISCLELWIASASILIICQLISLKVKTFREREKEKSTFMQYDSLLAPKHVHMYVCICTYIHTHLYVFFTQSHMNRTNTSHLLFHLQVSGSKTLILLYL